MKLGEGREAFFVFETSDEIPESLQTSPVISPATSPQSLSEQDVALVPTLQEPEFLDLNTDGINDRRRDTVVRARPILSDGSRAKSDFGTCHLIPRVCRSNDGCRCTYSTIYQLWASFGRCWKWRLVGFQGYVFSTDQARCFGRAYTNIHTSTERGT